MQTYDPKPRRRLWELMKSQGMQENQQVVFLSDRGEGVRQVREDLHPNSEHVIDWFHITMRLTYFSSRRKRCRRSSQRSGLPSRNGWRVFGTCSWHGNVEEALERLSNLLLDLELIGIPSASAEKLAASVAEFEKFIRNNQESYPNYGERYRQGETISTAFVESTINQVVSRRFVKRQQMHWTLQQGRHLLLQTRTKVLN